MHYQMWIWSKFENVIAHFLIAMMEELIILYYVLFYMFLLMYYHYNNIISYKEVAYMGKIKLLHGSDHIIEKPDLLLGKTNNDYGRGFYCTQELSMAMEWACKKNSDGFVNKYVLEQDSLNILNLLDGKYNILHWMALLLKNRTFRLSNEIAIDACDYIIENFSIDLKEEEGQFDWDFATSLFRRLDIAEIDYEEKDQILQKLSLIKEYDKQVAYIKTIENAELEDSLFELLYSGK